MALFATSTAVTVAGWFVSSLISKLLDHQILKWKEKKELKKGLRKEIQRLCNVLPQIKSITEDAEEKQFKNPGVHDWLRRLKDVMYDAQDVLDLYEVDLLLKEQRDTEPSSKKKVSFPLPCLPCSKKSKDGAECSSRLSVAKEIKRIREELDLILKQGIDFGLKDMVRSAPQDDPVIFQKRKTTSYSGDVESTFVGRGKVKKEMIEQLVPDMERPVHPGDGEKILFVLPIVGMGGLGKTTLAQLVFNDKRVVEFYKYRSRAWVCVGESTRDLDLEKTTASIIESMRSFAGKEPCNFKDLQALQTTLAREIEDPFLLVLDDAWDTNRDTWDKLLAPLKSTEKRCRVIVTTREEKVADAFLDRLHSRKLDFLDERSMWSIFKKYAFSSENEKEYSVLEPVGIKIVARLKGLPLAAKTIGGILHGNKNIQDWRKILESEQLLNGDNEEEEFMRSILMLSYNRLPTNMKQYFLCFSLFPKDYQFCQYALGGENFNNKWMIERMLFLIEAGLNSKDMTYDYVGGLLSRSLLQSFDYGDDISMHDLVHDMAEFIGKEEFLRISDAHQTNQIPEKIRHISFFQEIYYQDSDILNNLTNYKSLRTLLYSNRYERLNNSHGLLDDWCRNLRYLRVLTLDNKWILEVPDSIKNLKLLIYLHLILPKIKKIPATISELCKLKVLNVYGCDHLCELPNSVTRLVNLIHLDAHPELLREVHGIGKLTNLHELRIFCVEEKEGHSITELENMNELCGSLSISRVDRVKDRESAQQARLDRKLKLEGLNLAWRDDTGDGEWQVDIIKELRPSMDLEQLSIDGFQGTRLPHWLSLISLHHLKVTNCFNLVEIPSLPCTLRSLQLSDNGVKSLFSLPSTIRLPSLQSLIVAFCYKLDESLNALLEASSSSLEYLQIIGYNCPLEGLSCVTTLRELELRDCKEKIILNPTALITLRKMEIKNCPNMVVQGHYSDSETCSPLTYLTIENGYMMLKSLSQCRVLLTSLTQLKMNSCECDDLTLSKCLCNATALEELYLHSITNMTSLPSELMNKLAAIKELKIRDCHELVELAFPPVVDINITIENCHKLMKVEFTPATNISITIDNCPNLSFRRSSSLVNPVIERLDIQGFSGKQLWELFSISQNTPIQRIRLKDCNITYDAATSMLGGICRNATLEKLTIEDYSLKIRRAQAVSWVFPSLESLRLLTFDVRLANLAFTWGESSTPLFPSLKYLHAAGFSAQQLTDLINGLTESPIKRITISRCVELESFNGDLLYALLAFKNSLERLCIECCPNLRCLPTNLEVFAALRELEISHCEQMSTLPDGIAPTSLRFLLFRDCPALGPLYKDGHQWFSNIPRVLFL